MSQQDDLGKSLADLAANLQRRDQAEQAAKDRAFQEKLDAAKKTLADTLQQRFGASVMERLHPVYVLIPSHFVNLLFKGQPYIGGGTNHHPADATQIDYQYQFIPAAKIVLSGQTYYMANGGFCGMLFWKEDATYHIQTHDTGNLIQALQQILKQK